MNQEQGNPLGIEPVGTLLRKFAVPSVVSMLVMSLYNIVDQFFIGRSVGTLGNAATNVAFPMTTMCIAVALAFGIGGSSGFNLNMGKGEKNKAMYYVGNSIVMMFSLGVIIAAICQLFMHPMLVFFGAPNDVLPYAKDYVSVLPPRRKGASSSRSSRSCASFWTRALLRSYVASRNLRRRFRS